MKIARKSKQLSQESFALVSSRTYVSSLEKGQYSPTLNKLDQLAAFMDIHPLVLIALAYMPDTTIGDIERIVEQMHKGLTDILPKN